MTHTPGPCPWHRHVSDINGVVSVREKDGTVICQVWKPNDLTHARLIAAAPETAAERDRLKSANEHWHVRVTALKADVAVSLAERDRLKAIKGDLVAALEAITDIFEKTGPMPSAIAQQARTTLAKAQKEPSV